MGLLISGIVLLLAILGLFWAMDRFKKPILARIAYSELIARLAVLGAAFSIIGLLSIVGGFFEG